MDKPRRIGIIGLGAMGRPMARHLIGHGYEVLGCDPVPESTARAAASGVGIRGTPAEVAAESDLIMVVVGFDDEVEQVFFSESGLLTGSHPPPVVAIGSTVAPSYARALEPRVRERGIVLLDMALTRGEPAAESGHLLILGGGNEAIFRNCQEAFETFASDIFHLGSFGSGQIAKMVNNLILWACMAANDEGFRLGEALGVDAERLRSALVSSSAQNWSMSDRADTRPTPWAEKDLSIAVREADAIGMSLTVSSLIREVIKDFKKRRGYPTPMKY